MWDNSSRPSCAHAAMAPWTWGWSSWPPPLASVVQLLLPTTTLGLGLRGMGYLLPATTPDLGWGVTPLVATPDLGCWLSPLGRPPWPRMWGSSSQPFLGRHSLVLSATAPDLGRGVTPLGRHPSGMGSSRVLPLTSDVGWLLLLWCVPALWRAHRSCLCYGAATCAMVRLSLLWLKTT